MFYYRRKIILALLQKFNGELMSTPFQKYLFLLTRLQKDKSFDFVPISMVVIHCKPIKI